MKTLIAWIIICAIPLCACCSQTKNASMTNSKTVTTSPSVPVTKVKKMTPQSATKPQKIPNDQVKVIRPNSGKITTAPKTDVQIQVGAARLDQYLHLLRQKRVGLVVNQTSVVEQTHLVDRLLAEKIKIQKVFAPEHGFRGKADAGEKVSNSKDVKTGLPIVSLYGKNKKPTATQLNNLDIVVFDIQDVGARFYTYISTLHYVMEACAENNIPVIVLDRPNPNGHYVDGPVLEEQFKSFVGLNPIPVVHGMTVGELAQMYNGEKWLKNGVQCELTVIPCTGYDHNYFYELPIKPSPNLPNPHSIYLYPYLCFFEGTPISVGRGTDQQFQVVGHPKLKQMPYNYVPVSKSGAKYPKHENKRCFGLDLSTTPLPILQQKKQLDLQWLLLMYQEFDDSESFFNKNGFFNKLAGTSSLQKQMKAGWSEQQIRASWEPALQQFKAKRRQYLLYAE